VGVRRSEDGGWRWWCRFNAFVSAQEGRRRDEALPNDEADALVLAQWEGSMTWRSGVTMLAKGEAISGRGMEGDDIGWANVNLIGP
jgi:hypothetical protein